MTEVEKLHGLHNTGMTMHERFTLLARQAVGRRPLQTRAPRARGKGRTHPALIEAIINQLNQTQKPVPDIPFRGRGRGRGGLRRYGSEGSLRSAPGLRRVRSNSFVNMDNVNKDQRWRRSNGNLSNHSRAGSVSGVVRGAGAGYWLRGDAASGRGRGRGRPARGRVNRGRVSRRVEAGAAPRPARGSGRRGARRSARAQPAPARARGQPRGRGRGRGRGGITRSQAPKPVPTREELDAQLDQYMAGTKAALDRELDDYMRHAMDFD